MNVRRNSAYTKLSIGLTNGTNRTHRIRSLFDTEILSREDLLLPKRRPKPFYENTINCFTDGSKSGSRSGAGFTIWSDTNLGNFQIALGEHTTVFQAEIIAISEAAQWLQTANVLGQNINFYIDSQSAIKALGKYQIKNILVLECKNRLNVISEMNKVTLNWIPGHEGHMGNEVADRLAKAGSQLAIAGPEPTIAAAKPINKLMTHRLSHDAQQSRWENRKDCRQSKLFLPVVNEKTSKTALKMSKHDLRILTQIITGHANLKRHKHLMGLEDTPTCPACEEGEETPQHMLTECPAYAVSRLEIFNTHSIQLGDLPRLRAQDLVRFAKSTKKW